MKYPTVALIALALCLALPAQAGNNLNKPFAPARAQEAMGASATEGNQYTPGTRQHTRSIPEADDLYPDSVTCAVAVHGSAPGTRIPVPAGRKPADICPGAALTAIFFHLNLTGNTKAPFIPGAWPPPAGWAEGQAEQNKIAEEQLRALKKPPPQQTPEQKTPAQQPP